MSGAEIHSIGGQLVGYISVALAPDGSRLVAGAWDGSVTLWDTSSWSQLAHWQAHPYYALGVGFTADGKALITRGAARREWANWQTHVWYPPSLAEIEATEKVEAGTRGSGR